MLEAPGQGEEGGVADYEDLDNEGGGIYHMLGEEGGVADYEGLDKEGGGIYHMLGEEGNEVEEKTYEVPVSGIPQAPTVLGMEYSTLQHH